MAGKCAEPFSEATRTQGKRSPAPKPHPPPNTFTISELERNEDLDALGGLLGRAHDLSFLGDRLRRDERSSEWGREGHKLLAVIEVSQEDLQRGAADLAEHFFAERPRDFGDRIGGWLEDWKSNTLSSIPKKLLA
jgi:hypothetical protein